MAKLSLRASDATACAGGVLLGKRRLSASGSCAIADSTASLQGISAARSSEQAPRISANEALASVAPVPGSRRAQRERDSCEGTTGIEKVGMPERCSSRRAPRAPRPEPTTTAGITAFPVQVP